MPRYIDRDTALSHPFANGQYDKENANEHFIFGFEGYKEWLEQLPTVDAVEVVRCKDCIHYYADPWGYGNCVFEGGVSRRTKESDFCSWGEREEDVDK